MDARLEYRGLEWIFLALICLMIPYNWLIASLVAASIHELCNYAAVILTGEQVHSFRINAGGAVLHTAAMDAWKEVFCIAAGPVGSILLVFAVQWMPRVALCGLLQGVYNLLPVYPYDGGRILNTIVRYLFSDSTSDMICFYVKSLVLILILLSGICGWIHFKIMAFPIFAGFLLFAIIRLGKNSCKRG